MDPIVPPEPSHPATNDRLNMRSKGQPTGLSVQCTSLKSHLREPVSASTKVSSGVTKALPMRAKSTPESAPKSRQRKVTHPTHASKTTSGSSTPPAPWSKQSRSPGSANRKGSVHSADAPTTPAQHPTSIMAAKAVLVKSDSSDTLADPPVRPAVEFSHQLEVSAIAIQRWFRARLELGKLWARRDMHFEPTNSLIPTETAGAAESDESDVTRRRLEKARKMREELMRERIISIRPAVSGNAADKSLASPRPISALSSCRGDLMVSQAVVIENDSIADIPDCYTPSFEDFEEDDNQTIADDHEGVHPEPLTAVALDEIVPSAQSPASCFDSSSVEPMPSTERLTRTPPPATGCIDTPSPQARVLIHQECTQTIRPQSRQAHHAGGASCVELVSGARTVSNHAQARRLDALPVESASIRPVTAERATRLVTATVAMHAGSSKTSPPSDTETHQLGPAIVSRSGPMGSSVPSCHIGYPPLSSAPATRASSASLVTMAVADNSRQRLAPDPHVSASTLPAAGAAPTQADDTQTTRRIDRIMNFLKNVDEVDSTTPARPTKDSAAPAFQESPAGSDVFHGVKAKIMGQQMEIEEKARMIALLKEEIKKAKSTLNDREEEL
ncbi:uncharacterized protein BJ171DRAFT_631390 [Polychytrium aggregatum]|uniref:uncharacterized protein n=1 Tax=Polychytrium aggregatum TaxID=110093 RepID=UPI0022FEB864|nr:uncharacterized protein BJ171DRAFT_631390 [Polychytrium aggregatum]KAI9208714.1 hypothetical protein BJ171DRAFT_631390 [Polychytrium aggregatum]